MKGKIKARLIHILGGYTQEEYERATRFRPEPEINEQRLYTATCSVCALVKKEEWDKRHNTAEALITIREHLIKKLAPAIEEYAELSGPFTSNPEYYAFTLKIKVVKPQNDQEAPYPRSEREGAWITQTL